MQNLHLRSYVVPVKSTVEILQNFVAFSEYMNFKKYVVSYIQEWLQFRFKRWLKVYIMIKKVLTISMPNKL